VLQALDLAPGLLPVALGLAGQARALLQPLHPARQRIGGIARFLAQPGREEGADVIEQPPVFRLQPFESFDGLVVEHARQIGACAIIRGLRAMSDFEYEFEMALMNKHLNPEVETVFMMASQEYLYVSSSRLKELVRFGGEVSDFLPPLVAKRLREKLQSRG